MEQPLSELCPKCGHLMFNWPGQMTKCQQCLHEWYMDPSKQRPAVSASEPTNDKPQHEAGA